MVYKKPNNKEIARFFYKGNDKFSAHADPNSVIHTIDSHWNTIASHNIVSCDHRNTCMLSKCSWLARATENYPRAPGITPLSATFPCPSPRINYRPRPSRRIMLPPSAMADAEAQAIIYVTRRLIIIERACTRQKRAAAAAHVKSYPGGEWRTWGAGVHHLPSRHPRTLARVSPIAARAPSALQPRLARASNQPPEDLIWIPRWLSAW